MFYSTSGSIQTNLYPIGIDTYKLPTPSPFFPNNMDPIRSTKTSYTWFVDDKLYSTSTILLSISTLFPTKLTLLSSSILSNLKEIDGRLSMDLKSFEAEDY